MAKVARPCERMDRILLLRGTVKTNVVRYSSFTYYETSRSTGERAGRK